MKASYKKNMETIDLNKNEKDSKSFFDISSAALHIIAMLSMLIDHMFMTVIKDDSWILVLGRLAFPIFAFMVVEGYLHTHNYRKYIVRMLIFAVISEIPYDLMKNKEVFDRFDQNVLWTFLLALLCIRSIDFVKSKGKKWVYIFTAVIVSIIGYMLGTEFDVDYGGMGVLMVLIFYFFHDRKWRCMLLQFVFLLIINALFLGVFGNTVIAYVFGQRIEVPLQGFAMLSLIPIWLYHGRQGYHSKPFQYICYAFYPVHMIILFAISGLI